MLRALRGRERSLPTVAFAACVVGGLGAWVAGLTTGSVAAGVVALWLLVAASAIAAWLLPFPVAFAAPLFAGLLGWLVDMLPLLILSGWAAAVTRWLWGLWRERRMPRGWWVWLCAFLAVWTAVGVVVVSTADLKHFALLVALQGLISAVVVAVVDTARAREARTSLVATLCLFLVVSTAGVALRYAGLPLESLQFEEVGDRVEEAYGLDAFPNNFGMVKYALSSRGGVGRLRARLAGLAERDPSIPEADVFLPKLGAFENQILVRFEGSARAAEDRLRSIDVELAFDNVGLAPAHTVPRWRSFARNSLTYAGLCAVLFPLGWILAWSDDRRRRLLGRVAVACALLGAGYSLARGAWVAIAIGIVFVAVERRLPWRRAAAVAGSFVIVAALLTATFLALYGIDPFNARAGDEGSTNTRINLYEDTLQSLSGKHVALGFGTTRPREIRGSYAYIPRAGTHSTYLNYLFRTGVPGGLAIVALYSGAALLARSASARATGEDRTLATLVAAAAVIAAAHAVILSLYVEPMYSLVVSLVLGTALAIGSDRRPIAR